MGIEYCQNTAASQQSARERTLEADAQVRAQTKVLDALKAQLLEETATLSQVTAFSLESAASGGHGRDLGQCVARAEGEACGGNQLGF
jgi:hypothetical protein